MTQVHAHIPGEFRAQYNQKVNNTPPMGVYPLPPQGSRATHEIKLGVFLTVTPYSDHIVMGVSYDDHVPGSHTERHGITYTKNYEFFEQQNGRAVFTAKGAEFHVNVNRHLGTVVVEYHYGIENLEWSCCYCGEWNGNTNDPFCTNCETMMEEE